MLSNSLERVLFKTLLYGERVDNLIDLFKGVNVMRHEGQRIMYYVEFCSQHRHGGLRLVSR